MSTVGLTTNLTTLLCYDLALGQGHFWALNVAYIVSLSTLLQNTASIETLANVAMVGNSLSVGFGPFGILRNLWIRHREHAKFQAPNIQVLVAAAVKSCIWLTYGILKCARPIIVSHVVGLVILSNIFILYSIGKKRERQRKLAKDP